MSDVRTHSSSVRICAGARRALHVREARAAPRSLPRFESRDVALPIGRCPLCQFARGFSARLNDARAADRSEVYVRAIDELTDQDPGVLQIRRRVHVGRRRSCCRCRWKIKALEAAVVIDFTISFRMIDPRRGPKDYAHAKLMHVDPPCSPEVHD